MKIINEAIINDLLAKADTSPRKRSHFNIHESSQDAIQRYLVAAKFDSYIRPHRHKTRFELALVLRGRFDLIVFDDRAMVTERISLGPDLKNCGFELPPDVWHTWIPMASDSVFLEVKEGPYDPQAAAEYAGWSPPENDGRATGFLAKMRELAVGDSGI